jgi:outer membrane immunogenic protein
MKKLLIATLSIGALTIASANAADIAVRPRAVAAAPACAAAQFGGSYIGINGGAVAWTPSRTDQDEVLVDTASYVPTQWGGMIGGQVGHNWTTCNTVWGLEVDGDWVYARNTLQLIPNASPLLNLNITSRLDALVTARARAGIAVDNLLLYITGGFAAAHFRTTYRNEFFGIPAAVPGFVFTADSNTWRFGLVAGVGAEWAWTDRWTIRSELLYAAFAKTERTFLFAPPATFATFTESDQMLIARLALNYKFGGPVVARY